jgi:hypothetical protein
MTIAEKITTIAENEPKVYDKGYNDGSTMGYENGYTDGAQYGYSDGYNAGVADQKAVSVDWDVIQQKGARINYTNGFAYWDWEYGDPKYPVAPNAGVYGQSMFLACNYLKGINWDKFDLSKLSTFYNFCMNCLALENIGIDIAPTGTTSTAFYQAFSRCEKVKNIQKIVAKTAHQFTSTFAKCYELEEIRFAPYDEAEGIGIGNNISFADSPKLTRESIESICMALANPEVEQSKTLTFNTNVDLEGKMKPVVVGNGIRPFDEETKTMNGITFTPYGYGYEISVKGTATKGVAIYRILEEPITVKASAGAVLARLFDSYSWLPSNYLKMQVIRKNSPIVPEVIEGEASANGYFPIFLGDGDVIKSIELVIPQDTVVDELAIVAPVLQFDYKYFTIDENDYGAKWWNIIY